MNKVNSAVHYAADREEYAKPAKVKQCWPADFPRRNLNGTKHTAARSGRCLSKWNTSILFYVCKKVRRPINEIFEFWKEHTAKTNPVTPVWWFLAGQDFFSTRMDLFVGRRRRFWRTWSSHIYFTFMRECPALRWAFWSWQIFCLADSQNSSSQFEYSPA